MIEIVGPKYGLDPQKIKIKIIGKRPGEKIYEELTNNEEIRRTVEMEKYLCIVPATSSNDLKQVSKEYDDVINHEVTNPYNSSIEVSLTKKELREYLLSKNIV